MPEFPVVAGHFPGPPEKSHCPGDQAEDEHQRQQNFPAERGEDFQVLVQYKLCG